MTRATGTIVSDVASLGEQVRDAASRRATVRVVGAGTWLNAGRPTHTEESVSTADLHGILSYIPGDLTLTAGAGTTLGEVRHATARHDQWFALDPAGSDDGTLGATVATASAGPLATAFGTARDLVLGVEFVTGAGVAVRGGGRVVKNVAGFDLTRLLIGSWGTLGILTEVTVRLHARPPRDETMAVTLNDVGAVARTRHLLRHVPFTPLACEILNPALASQLLGTNALTALFRLGGNDDAVLAQRGALAELGDAHKVDPDVWDGLRRAEPADAMVFRLSNACSEIDRSWREAGAIADACRGTLIHAAPARGIVRCIVPTTDASVAWMLRAFAAPTMTTRIGERLPPELWPAVSPAPAIDPLSTGIRRAFNPSGILNPGMLEGVA